MTGNLWCLIGTALALGCGSGTGGSGDAGPPADSSSAIDAAPTVDAPGSIDASSSIDANVSDPADAGTMGPDAALPPASSILSPPYLMWVTRTAVSVRWETASPTVGRVDYGPTPGLGMSMTEPESVTTHELRITGLTPGQLNYYQIWFDGYALPVRSVHTAPAANDTSAFKFVVFGDNQDGPENFSMHIPNMLAENPDFAVSTGDCVQNGTRPEYREQLFNPISPLADHVPFLVGAGNHELYSDPGAVLFNEYMSQPGDEHCFGWRWGELFILFIDTELAIDSGPQGACIVAALTSTEATTATFQAAVFHKPPRIEWWLGGAIFFTNEMEAPRIRETLEPLFETYGVDVVFNGHNHLYTYTPETPGGITWVTTGGAGGTLDTDFWAWKVATWPEIDTTIHEHHFLAVSVDSGTMTVRAINIDGDQIHQFSVTP